jgi:hypothetical protein
VVGELAEERTRLNSGPEPRQQHDDHVAVPDDRAMIATTGGDGREDRPAGRDGRLPAGPAGR